MSALLSYKVRSLACMAMRMEAVKRLVAWLLEVLDISSLWAETVSPLCKEVRC